MHSHQAARCGTSALWPVAVCVADGGVVGVSLGRRAVVGASAASALRYDGRWPTAQPHYRARRGPPSRAEMMPGVVSALPGVPGSTTPLSRPGLEVVDQGAVLAVAAHPAVGLLGGMPVKEHLPVSALADGEIDGTARQLAASPWRSVVLTHVPASAGWPALPDRPAPRVPGWPGQRPFQRPRRPAPTLPPRGDSTGHCAICRRCGE